MTLRTRADLRCDCGHEGCYRTSENTAFSRCSGAQPRRAAGSPSLPCASRPRPALRSADRPSSRCFAGDRLSQAAASFARGSLATCCQGEFLRHGPDARRRRAQKQKAQTPFGSRQHGPSKSGSPSRGSEELPWLSRQTGEERRTRLGRATTGSARFNQAPAGLNVPPLLVNSRQDVAKGLGKSL